MISRRRAMRSGIKLRSRPSRGVRAVPRFAWLALAALILFAAAAALADPQRVALNQSRSPTPRRDQDPPIFAASTTAGAHRIPLPPGPPLSLHLSNFEQTIELRTRNGAPMPERLPLFSSPCRPIDAAHGDSLLRCSNGRIDAAIREVNGRRFLDLRELRGLPTDEGDEGPPKIAYPPELVGLGAACPGDTHAAKGECAFDAGDNARAQTELTAALDVIETRRFAALRLGDIALRRHDPNQALALYSSTGDQGMWGRLATERICELTGVCFDDPSLAAYDTVGLPEPLLTELTMRKLRALVLLGRWSQAMEELSNLLDASPASCMGNTKMLCRRLVLAAMRMPECPRETALSAYLRLPMFLSGELAAEMARAAGEDASELGAPGYGATLLSATARLTSKADLLAHAKEAISLYQAAGDPFRAHVMWSWASDRLSPKEARELPPDIVALASPAKISAQESLSADLENDESAAALVMLRSTMARARIAAPPGRQRRR